MVITHSMELSVSTVVTDHQAISFGGRVNQLIEQLAGGGA